MLEREVKLLFPDADAARTAIAGAGARPLRPRRLQDDALFDTSEGILRSRGCAVRIRAERADVGAAAQRAIVTFKGPVQPGSMKVGEEFAADELTIALDETPVGTFVEMEGSEAAILAMTGALGRSPADFILDSYYGLFVTRRDRLGLRGDHMMFPEPS